MTRISIPAKVALCIYALVFIAVYSFFTGITHQKVKAVATPQPTPEVVTTRAFSAKAMSLREKALANYTNHAKP